MPEADSKGKVQGRSVVSTFFDQYRQMDPIDFDDRAYSIIRDTHAGVLKGFSKYDYDPVLKEIHEPTWEAAVADTLKDFEWMRGQAKVVSRDEVRVDPDTSPGVVYKWLGCRAKVDGILDYPVIDNWLWETGWEMDYPILWKQAAKVELVKRSKIDDYDPRGFTIPPVDFVIYSGRITQGFDDLVKSRANDPDWPAKVGFVMQHGGFSHWGSYLERGSALLTSEDVRKFDSCFRSLSSKVCREVRLFAHDPTSFDKFEFTRRVDYHYQESCTSYVLMSTGEVLVKDTGLNSGKNSTSVDGCIGHMAITHYVNRRVTGLNESPDGYALQKRHYKFGVYSDDKNAGVSKEWAPYFHFQARATAYAELGFTLDPSKDVCSTVLDGHQWLGKTFRKEGGTHVPEANAVKLLCSLRNMESLVKPDVLMSRTLALMVEATFTSAFPWIRRYAVWLMQTLEVQLKDTDADLFEKWLWSIPTYAECRRFWLGTE